VAELHVSRVTPGGRGSADRASELGRTRERGDANFSQPQPRPPGIAKGRSVFRLAPLTSILVRPMPWSQQTALGGVRSRGGHLSTRVAPQSKDAARRFTILDAMIFMAASCPGLFHMMRNYDAERLLTFHTNKIGLTLLVICNYLYYIVPLMAMMTLAVFLVRFRRPRPPVRCIFREPGSIACFGAITVGLLFMVRVAALHVPFVLDSVDGSLSDFVREIAATELSELFWSSFWDGPPRIGETVGVLWLVLIVSGRWHAEPGWIDRLGRILGLFWVLIAPIWWFVN
jgi:hypothetical protein